MANHRMTTRYARRGTVVVPTENSVLVGTKGLTFHVHSSLIVYRAPLTRPEHEARPPSRAQPGPPSASGWMESWGG